MIASGFLQWFYGFRKWRFEKNLKTKKEEKIEQTPEQKKTEKEISERINQKNKNLPPELALKLEKLKNTILTKE